MSTRRHRQLWSNSVAISIHKLVIRLNLPCKKQPNRTRYMISRSVELAPRNWRGSDPISHRFLALTGRYSPADDDPGCGCRRGTPEISSPFLFLPDVDSTLWTDILMFYDYGLWDRIHYRKESADCCMKESSRLTSAPVHFMQPGDWTWRNTYALDMMSHLWQILDSAIVVQ